MEEITMITRQNTIFKQLIRGGIIGVSIEKPCDSWIPCDMNIPTTKLNSKTKQENSFVSPFNSKAADSRNVYWSYGLGKSLVVGVFQW